MDPSFVRPNRTLSLSRQTASNYASDTGGSSASTRGSLDEIDNEGGLR